MQQQSTHQIEALFAAAFNASNQFSFPSALPFALPSPQPSLSLPSSSVPFSSPPSPSSSTTASSLAAFLSSTSLFSPFLKQLPGASSTWTQSTAADDINGANWVNLLLSPVSDDFFASMARIKGNNGANNNNNNNNNNDNNNNFNSNSNNDNNDISTWGALMGAMSRVNDPLSRAKRPCYCTTRYPCREDEFCPRKRCMTR